MGAQRHDIVHDVVLVCNLLKNLGDPLRFFGFGDLCESEMGVFFCHSASSEKKLETIVHACFQRRVN
jgi:hypothetical protein